MKIGILGGTFDPPHIGHMALAEAAIEQLGLDEVVFVPAHRNPSKAGTDQSPAKQRLEMVRLAVQGRPKLAVSDIEATRPGPSYAVDTLKQLTEAHAAEYWFLLGADALRDVPTWKQPEKLVRLCRLGVAIRSNETPKDSLSRLDPEYRQYVDVIEMKPVNVSASEIRDFIDRGLPISQWVAPAVLEYIEENKLYRS